VSPKLIIFGGSGQVGRSLLEAASGTSCKAIGLSHADADVCDSAAVAELIRDHAPTAVVNAAAYTAVDRAEGEADLAFHVNSDGARVVAEATAAAGIPLIHLSTDYVFDGTNRVPYTESDRTAPLGIYGQSKDAGESAVRTSAPKHVILRTSWVYSPFGNNFVRTMLRLGAERSELRVIDDQTGCPTAAADIATAILAIARRTNSKCFNDWGTYHYAGADAVTWYVFAQLIFEEAVQFGVVGPKLSRISSAEFRASATRPAYSVLNSDRLGGIFGIRPKRLRVSLVDCLKSIFVSKDTGHRA
jgi:dTDP-4-dehydrorhamnose reductase